MELVTARGARFALRPTPEVARTKGVRKGRGPLGEILMCHLALEQPRQPPVDMSAPVVRLGEAHALADFLERVAAGTQTPATVPGMPAQRFAAPYLALDLAAADAATATFRIHLAVPPPGGTVADVHDLLARRVPFTVPRAAVAAAAAAWRAEIPPLPPT